jgi:hypothetical protein
MLGAAFKPRRKALKNKGVLYLADTEVMGGTAPH